jgi:predicted AAA+ superfamily ATPase
MILAIYNKMYNRALNLQEILKNKSLLLLGPRQTGKSTLIGREFPSAFTINLAERDTYRAYSARPELLRQRLPEGTKTVVVDEAQRLPEIFDEIQVIVDRDPRIRVVVTGSSARKLRTKGINLLPGRIWQRLLHPLVSCELQKARIQDRVIRGSLPGILDSEHFKEELSQYVGLYLEEQIRAESVTRSVGNFSRFLTVAALTNGEQLNYSNISNDAEVKINTVRAYYQILKDTLIGHELESFKDTKSRKSVTIPKFYLFDTGVVNGILNRFEVLPGTEIYGKMFEHLVFLELKAFIDYRRSDYSLHYWRSHTKLEVDFLLNREIAIEVKSSGRVADKEENSMLALAEETPLKRRIIVCNEKARRKTERGTEIIPIEEFLDMLWGGEF